MLIRIHNIRDFLILRILVFFEEEFQMGKAIGNNSYYFKRYNRAKFFYKIIADSNGFNYIFCKKIYAF